MRHVTATELALYYSSGLNETDADWVRRHLQECEACAEQYEYVRVPLDDLRGGLVRRLWGWRFKRLWRRIQEADQEIQAPAESTEASRSNGVQGEFVPSKEALLYATTAPGLSVSEKPKAGVYSSDGALESEVRADSYFDVDADGGVTAHVRVLERIDELEDSGVMVDIGNDLDHIRIGPVALRRGRDAYGEILEAELKRDPDPRGGLTAAQLKRMSLFVLITK